MIRTSTSLTVWLLALGVGSSGCAKTRLIELPPRLPFHVALLPAKILDDSTGDRATGLQVVLEPEWLNTSLASELRRIAFTRVTYVPIPDELGVAGPARDRYAIDRAHEADLIIQPIIRYDSRVTAGSNERFMESVRMFFTTPFLSWYLEDWDYSFNGQPVQLTARTYFSDTAEAPLRFASRLDQKVLEDDPQVEADDPALTFFERTGDNWEKYAVALLVPSGLLAGDAKTAAEEIRNDVVRSLAERLVVKLSREPRLFANPHKANVRLTRRAPTIRTAEDGSLVVSIGVAGCDPARARLESYRVGNGERLKIGHDSNTNHEIVVTVPREQKTVSIAIYDAQDSKRSFTFDLGVPEK